LIPHLTILNHVKSRAQAGAF